MAEASLYERLGGVFAIAAVVDHFSDAVVRNPIVGQGSDEPGAPRVAHPEARPAARPEVHADAVGLQRRGRPVRVHVGTKPGSTPLGLEEAHRELGSRPTEFDEVAAELARSLDAFNVPGAEKDEVLAAFAAHKGEVTEGYMAPAGAGA